MSRRSGHLRLGAFLYPSGHHIAAWRNPEAQADAGVNFRHYLQLAQAAEAAKFDLVFLADGVGTRGDNVDFLSRTAHSYVAQFEPITLLSALAAVTERIDLVGTASTSFNEPYHIARKFASLDHISGGRAGWNLVTSSSEHEAKNFNRDKHFDHAERYERATEFAQVTLASAKPRRTVGSYWPYATTLFDYIRRAMPYNAPESLSADEVYAVSAFLLNQNGIVAADTRLDAASLPRVVMPNRNGFVADPRPGRL